jgi:hypothetical protein
VNTQRYTEHAVNSEVFRLLGETRPSAFVAHVIDADEGLLLSGVEARPVFEFLLQLVQELRGAAGSGLWDQFAAGNDNEPGILRRAEGAHGSRHDGPRSGLQLGILHVQRTGHDVQGPEGALAGCTASPGWTSGDAVHREGMKWTGKGS